jgi:hypothetical protein
MGGGDDRPHFLVGEMGLEPSPLLRKHAAGSGELDQVGASARRLAHALGALDGTGAGIAGRKRVDHLGPEAADVAMAADDRQSGDRTKGFAGRGSAPPGCRAEA